MRREVMKGTVSKHPFCFRIFSCCSVKRETFIKTEKIGVLKQDEVLLEKKKAEMEMENKQNDMFDKKAMDYILDLS